MRRENLSSLGKVCKRGLEYSLNLLCGFTLNENLEMTLVLKLAACTKILGYEQRGIEVDRG
jgi:hypothetical protein